MTEENVGWRPNPGKKYDPNDPHFNPFYPPYDTPEEVLKAFWGDDDTPVEPPQRTPEGEIILPWLKKKEK